MQTSRTLIIGKSGSGKTKLAEKLLRDAENRTRYTVIINRKTELKEFCYGETTRINQDAANRDYPKMRQLIEANRRVHFTISAAKPEKFLEQLARAVLEIAEHEEATGDIGGVMFVIDEAHNFLAKGSTPDALLELFTGGRGLGIHLLGITQMLTSGAYGLDLTAIKQCSHLYTFRLSERNEVKRLAEMFPELGDQVTQLKRPENNLPPEYAVKYLDSERSGAVRRRSDGRRVYQELSV